MEGWRTSRQSQRGGDGRSLGLGCRVSESALTQADACRWSSSDRVDGIDWGAGVR
jgi:hypothetical protein